jgi:hypothetical protein
MSIYKITKHDNGSIILEPIQSTCGDIDNYEIVNNDNGDITLKKITTVKITNDNFDDLKSYDFTRALIKSCSVGDCDIGQYTYRGVLDHVYKLIGDGVKIIKHTCLNMSTLVRNDKGFRYNGDIGVSVRYNSMINKCVYEIANQCVKNELHINMNIKLNNGVFVELVF